MTDQEADAYNVLCGLVPAERVPDMLRAAQWRAVQLVSNWHGETAQRPTLTAGIESVIDDIRAGRLR